MISLTLKPIKERRPRWMKKTWSRRKTKKILYDTTPPTSKAYNNDPRKKVIDISLSFAWEVKSIRDSNLLDLLYKITCSQVGIIEPSLAFLRILHETEKKIPETIEVKRFRMSNSIKYCYFGVKQVIPQIKPLEKIVEGIITKDVKMVSTGIVETVAGELFATILLELIETNQQSDVH